MTLSYTGTASIRRILQVNYNFSGTSKPTEEDIIETIEDVQDEIDQTTQHAWREKTVTNEFYNFPREYPGYRFYLDPGIPIYLRHREIKAMGTATGDKIEIWEGGTAYTDWVDTKTQNRNNDFWVDHEKGIIYLKIFFPFYTEKAARITYRYGGSVVPKDIRRAASYMVAIELIENDDRSHMLTDTGLPNQLDMSTRVSRMQAKVNKILNRNRSEIIVI